MPRIAVITGASAGVGRATARAFAERGFDVALLARGQAGLDAAVKEVESAAARALAVPTDVADFAQVDRAASQVEAELGPIDVGVNDAMTTVFTPSWEVKPVDYQRAIEVTFLGQVWGTMAALARMRSRDKFIVDAALDGRRDKVIGSSNKLLVVAAKLAPGLGNEYAAIGAWESQLTPQTVSPNRPINLYAPADGDADHGAHGSFDDKAGGFMDPNFLESLPTTAKGFVQATVNKVRYKRVVRHNKKRLG